MVRTCRNALLAGAIVYLLVTPVSAGAEPNDDIAAAAAKWAAALAQHDAEKIVALYAADAVLWPTMSPTIRSGQAAIREYFVAAFKTPELKVSFGQQSIRTYGSTAVNSGDYTFSFVRDGETRTLPARYSFTYIKSGSGWLIVDHHSSPIPKPSM
jgi:uncharacterized protein (TIGR02246 family)